MKQIKKYQREGKTVFFDVIRNIFVLATEEETIRQKQLIYLTEKWNISKTLIKVEENMSHHKKGARDRADIVILHPKTQKPFVVYEIKAPHVYISDDTLEQARKYNQHLNCNFICITNLSAEIWYSIDNGKIKRIETPRSFNNLLKSKIKYSHRYEFLRPSLKECGQKQFFIVYNKVYGAIGEDTPQVLHSFILNFYGFLMDSIKYVKSPIKCKDFTILEDGIRSASFGNAAGGTFDGFYRYFILKFPNGDNNIISISTFGTYKFVNDPKYGNRTSTTYLNVAIDDFEKKHNSLELNLDKFLSTENEKWEIIHNGKMAVGKVGSAKKSDVLDFCKKHIPDLVKDDIIFLGALPKNELFNWENSKEVIINLIRYALVRDKYREAHKANMS